MTEKAQNLIPRVIAREIVRSQPPTNTEAMLDWIKNNPEVFQALLLDLDILITDFNSLALDKIPTHFFNARSLKEKLTNILLPTITSLTTASGLSNLKEFITVINETRALMEKGEQPKENRVAPYLRYHTTNTTPKNLVIGGVLHAYEDLISSRPGIVGKFERDEVVDSLVEIASLHLETGLIQALAQKTPAGIDWVDGYKKFSNLFKRSFGY